MDITEGDGEGIGKKIITERENCRELPQALEKCSCLNSRDQKSTKHCRLKENNIKSYNNKIVKNLGEHS